jgi:hypothetical protein
VSFQKIFKRGFGSFLVITSTVGVPAFAQQTIPAATTVRRAMPVASGSNLYCAGFVQTAPINTDNRIVGAVEEQERFNFSQNNYVYINMGTAQGVKAGDMFSVVRPKGKVESRWAKKDPGFYVQEVGAIEVVNVKPNVSVARIKTSCDTFMLGDLVQPTEVRVSPNYALRPSFDLWAESGNNRPVGRIFFSRDNLGLITRDQVVYIDLGVEDNIKAGDFVTVFRPLGAGHLFDSEDESVSATDYGYESDRFRNGKFSNQSARKKGERARGGVTNAEDAKEDRPDLRKVVGEAMIVNVKERSATAVITRTAQEIMPGDYVEVQ